ncbi:Phospholipase D precursor [compost metagenome]
MIIVDGSTVETGSFNFAKTAEFKNSENVIVIHNAPDLVAEYLAHWENRWQQGVDFSA